MDDPVIVMVAYENLADVEVCVDHVGAGAHVVIVDNSAGDELRLLAARLGARYLRPGRNVGFGAAVNLALAKGGIDPAQDVLLLNPDARVSLCDVRELSRFLHAPEQCDVAAVSPKLVYEDGSLQRVAWPYPSPRRAIAEAVGLGRISSRTFFVIGAVLLLRAEAREQVGRFDEQFFLYAEETDWQRRARDLGWRSAVCESVCVEHRGAGASSDDNRRESLFHAAHEIYIRKWFGPSGWAAFRWASFAGAAARAALIPSRRSEEWRRANLYLFGPRRVTDLRSA